MTARTVVILALLVVACRPDAAPRERAGAADSARIPVAAMPGSPLVGGGEAEVALAPGFLDAACVRGETATAVSWKIEGLDPAFISLTPLALASLSARDSARLVSRLTRVADALPSDSGEADFRGLPVVVRDAWRLVPQNADTVFVAFVARRLPMESNPLEEDFTLIATPGLRQGVREALNDAWHAREVGREESLELRELAAAILRPEGTLSILFVRPKASGDALEVVTRADGRWRVEWSGPVARCR